eukprot:1161956-Pelagomonas_calceolata.AAC.24
MRDCALLASEGQWKLYQTRSHTRTHTHTHTTHAHTHTHTHTHLPEWAAPDPCGELCPEEPDGGRCVPLLRSPLEGRPLLSLLILVALLGAGLAAGLLPSLLHWVDRAWATGENQHRLSKQPNKCAQSPHGLTLQGEVVVVHSSSNKLMNSLSLIHHPMNP